MSARKFASRLATVGVSRGVLIGILLLAVALVISWQVVHAQAPEPNPISSEAKKGLPGPAAAIHGDPLKGRTVFASFCARCHGDRGVGGIDNPGSDDGTVPPLNPADSGFLDDSHGDPALYAQGIDLFIQHGSRPEGDNPVLDMPAWGDQKLMSQQQIADAEAYVMQLNGLYWPDHWYPPAEVDMDATRQGNTVTYSITVLNEGSSPLGSVLLRDTLPPGLAFISSSYFGLGNNPAKVDGSTVEWELADIPSGGSAGPFTIVTGLTGQNVPSNVSQVLFTFCTWDGNCQPASQVSEPTLPPAPVVKTAPPPVVLAQPTLVPTVTAPTPTALATSIETPAGMTETPAPTPTEIPATPTPQPVVAVPRPSNGNLTGGAALSLVGSPDNGMALFAQKCKSCHGDQGKGGINNPGSSSGTIPPLNPIEEAFKNADQKIYAYNLDLYMEHGSKPAGPNPLATMPAWGDQALLTPQQIADLIAYVISLNP